MAPMTTIASCTAATECAENARVGSKQGMKIRFGAQVLSTSDVQAPVTAAR